MSKAYAVSRGSYSDYQVEFVCPTREIADALAAKLNVSASEYNQRRVETISLVEHLEEVEYRPCWYVWIDIHGSVVTTRKHDHEEDYQWVIGEEADEADEVNGIYEHPNARVFGCSYRGPQVALKIARDKLAQIKAEAAGL